MGAGRRGHKNKKHLVTTFLPLFPKTERDKEEQYVMFREKGVLKKKWTQT